MGPISNMYCKHNSLIPCRTGIRGSTLGWLARWWTKTHHHKPTQRMTKLWHTSQISASTIMHMGPLEIEPPKGTLMVAKYSDCGLMIVSFKWNGEHRGVSDSKSFLSLFPWLTHNQTTNRCYLNVALRQTRHGGAPLTLWECDPLVTLPSMWRQVWLQNHLYLPQVDSSVWWLKQNDSKGADWWFRMF